MKLFEVNHLQVHFNTYAGVVKAVRGISFSLEVGEVLAIVGESGCGKTVTVKSLLRLHNPTMVNIPMGTEILYKGQEVLKMNKKQLQQFRGGEVSMVFQDPMTSLNPTMRIGDQIIEALLIHTKIDKKEAVQVAADKLHMVGMPNPYEQLRNYPHQLSGGMRQRVSIAIALSCNPKVLLADEPTTALDVTIQAQILDLLIDYRRKTGMSMILVTHDLGVVANLADRILVMYAGKIVERGSAKDIFYRCRHPYTRALLDSIPKQYTKQDGALYSLKGSPPDLLLELPSCAFAQRCKFCMPICLEQAPPETFTTDGHGTSCWLQHPNAPDVGGLNWKGGSV